jgi:hypothetical protein
MSFTGRWPLIAGRSFMAVPNIECREFELTGAISFAKPRARVLPNLVLRSMRVCGRG